MKTIFNICGLLILGGLMFGCSTVFGEKYNYSVRVKNLGNSIIYLEPSDLYDKKDGVSKTLGGELKKGWDKTSGPYFLTPSDIISVRWKNLDTNEKAGVMVSVKLPKEFDKDSGYLIVFNINPEKKDVKVTYIIRNLAQGKKDSEYSEIDSNGNIISKEPFKKE